MSRDVTIVICTRNRGSRLAPMLRHLEALVSEISWKALIVDNGSSDNTAEILEDFVEHNPRVKYLYQPVPGLGISRKIALDHVSSDIVTFTDDDCYLNSDFVDCVSAAFQDNPDVSCIGGRIELHNPEHARVTIDERSSPHRIPPYTYVPAGALYGANLSFDTNALRACGGFDADLGAGTPFPCEDIDAVAALIWNGGQAAFDPRPTVRHDHGRTEADIPALEKSYDAGRGAYLAKYIALKSSRIAYLKAWWWASNCARTSAERDRFARECMAFLRYSAFKRHLAQLCCGLVVLPVFYAVLCLSGFGRSQKTSR